MNLCKILCCRISRKSVTVVVMILIVAENGETRFQSRFIRDISVTLRPELLLFNVL
jgi:hypothetical protein